MPKAKRKLAPKPKSRRKSPRLNASEIEFSIKPGERTTLTIEAGEETAGKVPVRIRLGGGKAQKTARQVEVEKEAAWLASIRKIDLATWLFVGAVTLYLVTRLVGLAQFPIYFFSDEAIQTQTLAELISNSYRDTNDVFLPTYFKNGEYVNLSLSVYLQWIPLILFGKSAVITRATSVLITLIAALSVGIVLRNIFNNAYWWAGTLFLSITPAWFLHSRTAFETAEFSAFSAGALCAYLLYRYRSPNYLYLTCLLAACAFYSYSPGQLIVPFSALALLVSDWRYHWANRRVLLKGGILLAALAIPFVRYRMEYPNAASSQLYVLGSYLFDNLPISEKALHYLSEYATGLSPWYWYVPNDRDLPRHLMKGYGHILIGTLPFAIVGLTRLLTRLREPSNRAILIALLTAPVSAALVQIGITRVLTFVVPMAILTTIGLEWVAQWLSEPLKAIHALQRNVTIDPKKFGLALLLLAAGVLTFVRSEHAIDRFVWLALFIILALYVSELAPWLIGRGGIERRLATWKGWVVPQAVIATVVFVVLAYSNIAMLYDALKNGPLWYRDYGLSGMQYGAFQIFDIIKEYEQEHPETRIILSPAWANGTDVVTRFFLDDSTPIEMGNIDGYLVRRLPLDENDLFIMTPQEYRTAAADEKFTDLRVEKIVPYPDGTPGFYFARLRYSNTADELFAAEEASRAALREATVNIDGQEVQVKFSFLSAGDQEEEQREAIQFLFDHDDYSLAKTFEANPFVVELTFPSPRTIHGFSIIVGAANAQITILTRATPDAETVTFTFEGQGTINEPELSFEFPQPVEAQWVRLELLDPNSTPPAQIHIWELEFR